MQVDQARHGVFLMMFHPDGGLPGQGGTVGHPTSSLQSGLSQLLWGQVRIFCHPPPQISWSMEMSLSISGYNTGRPQKQELCRTGQE